MRKVFLHIGCGKTGSSALQLWLHNNAAHLAAAGIHYPVFGLEKLEDYTITSGNGVHVMNAITKGTIVEFLERVASHSDGDILFSSEAFQALNAQELETFRSVLASAGLSPVIIAYVRDVYDMTYSSYLQLVKRHLYTGTFREFALSRRDLQQFKVVRTWDSVFDDVRVVHYDSEKESLDSSFCRAVGIAPSIPPMPKQKVNRSLMLEEAELLRLINKLYIERFDAADQSLGRIISDTLIMENPEAVTPILMDEKVIDYAAEMFSDEINWLNSRFFDGREVLQVFNPEGKVIAEEVPTLGLSVTTALRALMSAIGSFDFGKATVQAKPVKSQDKLEISDPRIVDALREEALRNEQESLVNALALMTAAKILRPNGPFITRKVGEYSERLKAEGYDKHA